jgi:leucyl-tRNA synthetase
MLRITAYADRLLKDLDTVDYLSKIKSQQIEWIGRSEGAEIDFPILVSGSPTMRVFTTRPDTLYGVTYLVLSPEHDLVGTLLPFCENRDEIRDYVAQAAQKPSFKRSGPIEEVSGVQLRGVMGFNPANEQTIPVWLSDYVLSSYGTGAIMAVPGHDERDWRFAKKHKLPITEVISGGNTEEAAFTDIDRGVMANSKPLDGLKPCEAMNRMTTIMQQEGYGRPKVRYRLRDWVFSRQRFWGEPIPMVYCETCGWVPVPESELPLQLPDIEHYQPTTTGESPLAQMEDWVNTDCPKCHRAGRRETDTMPQWAGSSWYFLRFCDPHNDKAIAGREKLEYWMPVDWYNGGMEHTTLHLLYSRFWHKFLYDISIVPTSEPYKKRTSHGLVLGQDGQKMSKSRGNVINPDDIIQEFGADALRLYEVFMGDFEQPIPWSTNGLVGMSRFLQRVWRMQDRISVQEPTKETTRLLHQTIKDVGDRVEGMKFNTALAALMQVSNHFSSLAMISIEQWEIFLRLLSPFAPHISEELWAGLGKKNLLCMQSWPIHDPTQILRETRDVPVQVDGKLRQRIRVAQDATDEEINAHALQAVAVFTQGKSIRRVIIVRRASNIIVNVVIGM